MKEITFSPITGPGSVSRLLTYEKCPHKAFLKYKAEIPEFYEIVREVGSKVHKGMEDYGNVCMQLGVRKSAEAAAMILQNIQAEMTQDEWENIEKPLTRFIEGWEFPSLEMNVEKRLAVNKHWEPCDYDDPDAHFRIRCDLDTRTSDTSVSLVDYKSGYKIALPGSPKAELQLKAYAAVYFANFPEITHITARNLYIRDNTEVEIPIDNEGMDQVKKYIDAKMEVLRSDTDFVPKLNYGCGSCGAAMACVHWQKLNETLLVLESEPLDIRDEETARLTAEALFKHRSHKDSLQKKLVAYIKSTGRPGIATGADNSIAFAHKKSITKTVSDTAGLVNYLIGQKVDLDLIWKHLGMTMTNLDKLLKTAEKRNLWPEITNLFVKTQPSSGWDFVDITKDDDDE